MGSFKLSYDEIKKKLLQFDEEVITQNALENFIKFLPNREQVGKLIYKLYWTDLIERYLTLLCLGHIWLEARPRSTAVFSPQYLLTGF